MDAEHLDFPDASFDRVVCGFGVMFWPKGTQPLAQPTARVASGPCRLLRVSYTASRQTTTPPSVSFSQKR